MEVLVVLVVIIVGVVVGVPVEFVFRVRTHTVHVMRVGSLVGVVFAAVRVSILVPVAALLSHVSVRHSMSVVVVVRLLVSMM